MKLVNLVPGKEIKEDLEDMDTAIPAKVERFLDRALSVIKSYNLSRKKEQLVVAKLIDALGMSPQELQQAVQKLKKYKIVKR
jgi:Mn-dependent DtxR family transcriptional regulator